jgi:hypothetical protein
MYRVKIEPMPENKAVDPNGLWRLVVYQYQGSATKAPVRTENGIRRLNTSI